MTKAKSRNLMDEAEHQLARLLRDVNRKKTFIDGKGEKKVIEPDVAERVQALRATFVFLGMKHKIAPEAEESEFERQIKEYHDERGGKSDNE
jgi:ABC-type transporter MlaC component